MNSIIQAVIVGLIAALVVMSRRALSLNFPDIIGFAPIFVLGIGATAIILSRFKLIDYSEKHSYDGIPDLFVNIHDPTAADSPIRWAAHSLISFLLSFAGVGVGIEGAAIEATRAYTLSLHTRSSRWIEQFRRTDTAACLSAAMGAAFGTPFAGVLLPMEMGIGGKGIIVATSAVVAYLVQRFLSLRFSLGRFDVSGVLADAALNGWQEWLAVGALGLVMGGVGILVIYFIRYTQKGLRGLFESRTQTLSQVSWLRILTASVLLAIVFFIYRSDQFAPAWAVLEDVLWQKRTVGESALLALTHLVILSLALGGFGTAGLFWPLFVLGGLLGFCLANLFFGKVVGLAAVAGLCGGAALWGAVLGVPFTGAVMVFELTQSPQILFGCLIAAFLAKSLRQICGIKTLVEKDLDARGIPLVAGRSASVLKAVLIRDAMIADHETVHEKESITELQARILKARYPFLPVVNDQKVYCGLLTTDMIQKSWQTEQSSSFARLIEAKDVLHHQGSQVPVSVKANDSLIAVLGIFEKALCVAVLDEEKKVVGLLFAHNVRLAYDREVIRRSFALRATGQI